MTITPEERTAIRKIAENTQTLNWTDNIHEKLMRLLDALETAESGLDAAYMVGLHKGDELLREAQARIAQLEAVAEKASIVVSKQFDTVDTGNGVKYARAIFDMREALRAAGYDDI